MHAHTHEHTHTTSVLQTGLPPSSPSSCDCQTETDILWKAQCKFILYLLEYVLHFTARLSLRVEQRLCALRRRQTQSIGVLFLEASSLTAETSVWWNHTCELRCTAVTRWCYLSGDAAKARYFSRFYLENVCPIPTRFSDICLWGGSKWNYLFGDNRTRWKHHTDILSPLKWLLC